MGVRLPPEYQEVEYLESTGTQYINTWIVGRDSIYAESRLMFTQTDFGNAGFLGSRQGGGDQRFYLISAWQGDWKLGLGEDFFSTTAVLPNTLYDIKVGRDWNTYRFALNVNGADILSGSSRIQTTYDMYVFAVNNYGTASRFCSARLYLLKISNDNSLLRDYIPCYRKSDNKPGMYDLVSGTFFTNQGMGEFLVGPDVINSISPMMVAWRRMLMMQKPIVPSSYTVVNKLISLGTDTLFPYINTGIVPNSNYGFDVTCETYCGFNQAVSYYGCIFGGRFSSGNFDFQLTTFTASGEYWNNGNMRWGNSGVNRLPGRLASNRMMHVTMLNGVYSVDGVEVGTIQTLINGTRSMYLFGLNTNGTPEQHGRGCAIYNAKFYDDNGTLIRNYVPVVRKADDKPGLYDTVEKQFCVNASQTSVEFTWE